MQTNAWCETLGINVPRLETVKAHREANTFSLLLVALLECGGPMTLAQIAARFEAVGIAPRERALLSLQRCKPARAPVYRDGDQYQLDPHDHELDLWTFRLGLRRPNMPRLEVFRPEPPPVPGTDVPLTTSELDEAFKDAGLSSWSRQRLALAVLDAAGGAMPPREVVAFVAARTKWHSLRERNEQFGRQGSAIEVLPDGRWSIEANAGELLASARKVVRDRVELARRHAAMHQAPEVTKACIKATERRAAEHAAQLAKLRHGLLFAFPSKKPEAVALVDVNQHELTTFVGDELALLGKRLSSFDVVGAIDVRPLLRALAIDPGEQRLAELGPPQKTMKLNQSGRVLKISTAMLVQSSCGISRPFGDASKLESYLIASDIPKLRRRMEANVKSLHALYQFGRLHGAVRLRWGFLDEWLVAPRASVDEPKLGRLMKAALESHTPLEVVVGAAPGWENPWARRRQALVQANTSEWQTWLVDEDGLVIDEAEVQLARLTNL